MYKWTNDERMMIACCNDGTRPVIFKIERIDIPENEEEKEWLEKQNFKNSVFDAYTGKLPVGFPTGLASAGLFTTRHPKAKICFNPSKISAKKYHTTLYGKMHSVYFLAVLSYDISFSDRGVHFSAHS